jgi:hypothetical protein
MTQEKTVDVESVALYLDENGPRSLESLIMELGPAVRVTMTVGELIRKRWVRVVVQDERTLMVEPRRRRSRMLTDEAHAAKKYNAAAR